MTTVGGSAGTEAFIRAFAVLQKHAALRDVPVVPARSAGAEAFIRAFAVLQKNAALREVADAPSHELNVKISTERIAQPHSVRNAADFLRKAADSDELQDAVSNTFDSPGFEGLFRDFEGAQFDAVVESIRENMDRKGINDLERQFTRLPQSEDVLRRAATELDLTIPFDHDPAVRAALQFVVAAVYSLFMVSLVVLYPVLVAMTTVVVPPPSAPKAWKYIGTAYDKLYDKKHYHPENGIDPPSDGPHLPKGKGVW